jgi:glycosyltransferase involved in cell wall biosynthesis
LRADTGLVSAHGAAECRPSVAIVIPCHNAERTLGATLKSALSQRGVLEVIAVDDGSSDATLAVVRSFEPRTRVVTGPNGGVSAARNRGIAETTADWLQFLDADDLLEPDTVAARLHTARASGADVVICDWEETLDEGSGKAAAGPRRSVDWRALAADAEIATATHVWAPPAAILYRRGLVERIGGFRTDLPVAEDARFLFDAAYRGARFAHSAHIGARYRVAAGSLSRQDPALFWTCVLRNGRQIEALWRARGALDSARRQAIHGIYNHAARGLFALAHPCYFEAVAALRSVGLPLPHHSRIATPLARLLGLGTARSILQAIGRA